jgi:uncharacterized membrane protein YjjP (DUF1212 family)
LSNLSASSPKLGRGSFIALKFGKRINVNEKVPISYGIETKTQADTIHHYDDSFRFIIAMARAYLRYGGYSFETDVSLTRIIEALGLNGEINATPNFIEIAVWLNDESRQTIYMAMTRDTDYNLAKLAQVENLSDQVVGGKILPAQGLERLKEIDRAPYVYGNLMNSLAFVLCGAGFAVVIGMSWLNVFLGGVFGLISFGVTLFASRNSRMEIIKELLAAAIVVVLASGLAVLYPGIIPLGVTVCAVVWFIPGFGLTIAPREIIYGNTLSGIIHFTNALVVGLKLLLGALLGLSVSGSLFPASIPESLPGVSPVWAWVFVPVLVIGLAFLFRVMPQNLGLVLAGGWLVWAGVQMGNVFGYWQGTFLGAVILTVYARLASARFRISSATILLPVIMILVPGYAFLRALYIANEQGAIVGISAGLRVFVIIGAIIAGIFVGDAIGSFDVVKRSSDMVKIIKR